ncbi:MAG: ABC transporter permease [Saprospiraceae bacterium]|nr:ABC transporter permease [Saprospiraceae bacterium]
MILNTLKLIFRGFTRNKGAFTINLVGLSIGLGCALLIYYWVDDEMKVDKFLQAENGPFELIMHFQEEEGLSTGFSTPSQLAEDLPKNLPEIKHSVALRKFGNVTLAFEDNTLKADGHHASPAFFELFNYELIEGDAGTVLMDKSSVVISDRLAIKLFNTTENIVGKVIQCQQEIPYQISGIFKAPPSNASLQFDFVLSFEEFKARNAWALNWNYSTVSTFVALREGADVSVFNQKVEHYLDSRRDENQLLTSLEARDYTDAYLFGTYENGQATGGRIQYVRLFSLIGMLILLIACINFMNLSTAMASERSKEVGVKKVLGLGRGGLALQFLGETVVLSFIALGLALTMVNALLPTFSQLTGKDLVWSFNGQFLLVATGLTLLTGLVAGSYPSLFMAAFKPAAALKGKLILSAGSRNIRKVLVVGQFILSFMMIVAAFIVYQQLNYLQTKNLGYNKNNLLQLDIEGKVRSELTTFLSAVKQLPGVKNASSIGQSLVGDRNTFIVEQWEGKTDNKNAFEMRPVNYDMIETLDVEILAGRSFSDTYGAEENKIIFNESAIKFMGLENPLGTEVAIQGTSFEIIGVSRDFHFTSLREEIGPLFFVYRPDWTHKVMIRTEAGQESQVVDRLQKLYTDFNPGFPFDYEFLDEDYQAQYAAEEKVSSLSKYFTFLAIFISCLGLFGLATFDARRRVKEIGIRKVLGAGVLQITSLLSKDFLRLVMLAILIATPLAWYVMKLWLNDYAYGIDIHWGVFALAGLTSLFIAMITVGFQSVKSSLANPILSLRDE